MRIRLGIVALWSLATLGCGDGTRTGQAQAAPREAASAKMPEAESDPELEECHARLAQITGETGLPGAPRFEENRAEILGRARGEPMVLIREPAAPPDGPKPGFSRVKQLEARHRFDKKALRTALLREGYVYSVDPHEALALVNLLDLTELFDEPVIYLERGEKVFELTRSKGRFPTYRYADGSQAGLLLGDRVAVERNELAKPLHRDLRALGRRLGFDRARIQKRTEAALVAELRFGGRWVRTLLEADGARLDLGCFDAPAAERKLVREWMDADARRRTALDKLHAAIDQQVAEALPFDRPRDEKTAEKDGQLRPEWRWAYLHGQGFFSHEQVSYPVFDGRGRPMPPQMCVDFVLDSFERAAGTWFSPQGPDTRRIVGTLDLDQQGIKNRRSVLAFEQFARESPDLFEHRRLQPEERIPFGERSRFFAFLLAQADRFRPGDVVAIQGRKADGLIHQHAILIEDTDPVTGFPDALADQMKRPRRRTWEGIMAEAPLRSLLFHVRPKDSVLLAPAK